MKGDLRAYGRVGLIGLPVDSQKNWVEDLPSLVETGGKLVSRSPEITRVLFAIGDSDRPGRCIVALRAINTRDFMTAEVTRLSWRVLEEAANDILRVSPEVSGVYYDITPKPPATVEYE